MLGVPMPPDPDEPIPRRPNCRCVTTPSATPRTQRRDEFRVWGQHGLYLGESDPEVEHMAALRAAVEIARMTRKEAK